MSQTKVAFTNTSHFAGKAPVVREIYDRLIKVVKGFGTISEEPKKTSIHIVNKTALAGVATRKNYLILTIKSDTKLTAVGGWFRIDLQKGRLMNL